MVDPNLQRKVVEELRAGPGDTVLEVGPGHGELTRHLVGRIARLVLVEKDETLVHELRERWGGLPGVHVVAGDVLELELGALLPPGPYRIVSNLPYNITSPLLFAFLEMDPAPVRIVVTVQREVAERIAAAPGSKQYGALSVGVQARGRARIAFGVGRRAFRPVPDVDSAVVTIDPDPALLAGLPAEELRRLSRAAFGLRRKQLQKILRSSPEYRLDRRTAEAVCRRLGLDPRARPETFSAADFVRLARALADVSGDGPSEGE